MVKVYIGSIYCVSKTKNNKNSQAFAALPNILWLKN
jgi:hypothetical protein